MTGVSSGVATATIAVCAGSRSVSTTSRACEAIGPTRAISANVLGVRSSARPWPDAGASTITRSYGDRPASQRGACASSQALVIVTSSRAPGAAPTNAENARERSGQLDQGARPDDLARPLAERALRIERRAPQPRGDLLLGSRGAGGGMTEQPRDPPLPGDLAHDRAPAGPRREQRERGGDGRLADAALARHDDEPVIEQ